MTDCPIIVDIIKAKLAKGEQVWMVNHGRNNFIRLVSAEVIEEPDGGLVQFKSDTWGTGPFHRPFSMMEKATWHRRSRSRGWLVVERYA